MLYDPTRPALILIRLILALTAGVYGCLRLLYDDRSPMFGLTPGDPAYLAFPYETNPTWAKLVVTSIALIAGFVVWQTVWHGFKEYVEFKRFGVLPTPWPTVAAMTVLSIGGVYYATIGVLLSSPKTNAMLAVFLAACFCSITAYEYRRKDAF